MTGLKRVAASVTMYSAVTIASLAFLPLPTIQAYLEWLSDAARRNGCQIHAYVLTPLEPAP